MLNYLTLDEAGEVLPGRRNRVTIWRWCEKGIRVRRTGRRTRLKHIHTTAPKATHGDGQAGTCTGIIERLYSGSVRKVSPLFPRL